ncbi:ATP-dependent RNA helicase DDX51 isoform X1 [Clupea harengus]|uniref:ATP-dependent RNA helicase n=1 Tax=Clupea harengus TaxID=7950 RepID=A0A6P3VZT9_CLUHA|nr:ATP-dependent RNA helicase DDX51 isoform X1 [Clupea harengus]
MSLFLMNRYLGDDDDDEDAKESRSKALLEKLQKQAKEREQQALSNRTVVKSDTNKTEEDEKEVKRKRKEPEDTEELSKVKKSKKKSSPLKTETAEDQTAAKEISSEVESSTEAKQQSSKDKNESEIHADISAEPKSSSQPGFPILGGFEKKTVQKVHRVLPQWLAQPDVIQKDIKSNLVPVSLVPGICPKLMKRLEKNGIHNLFPVQAEVIPAVLEGVCHGLLMGRGGYRPRDICVSAPTGSGKTLAFAIPIVQALSERVLCQVRALIVLPTKELAQQVYKVFCTYAEGTNLKVVMIAGQKSFAAEQASLSENKGALSCSLADIVVATPGRLVDHINKNDGFSLQHLRFLVIDEADRMIDSMHQSWLKLVTQAVYKKGGDLSIFGRREPGPITAASLSPSQMPLQKLLFSATLTQNPEKLQQLGLHQPRLFSSIHSDASTQEASQPFEKFNFPEGLTEYYIPCTLSKKPLILLHLLLRLKFSTVLCFTNSREAAHRLFMLVKLFGGVQVAEFSSRLSPSERKKTLRDFEQEKIQLVISTDAAARGIDIQGVKCVVNYDAPQFIRTYIHRVGRTARAGKSGISFTFLLGVQEKNFLQMVTDAGSPSVQKQIIQPESLKSMEACYEQTLVELGNAIKDEKAKKRRTL